MENKHEKILMAAARPRNIIAPLQLGLGIEIHHKYKSRFAIDMLNSFGFSSSYSEVLKFNKNAAVAALTLVENHNSVQFIQYVGDNVDHDVCTIDGKHTFHGMGCIACATPAIKTRSVIPRKNVIAGDIKNAGKIDIIYGPDVNQNEEKVAFKKLNKFLYNDPTENLDTIWKTSILFGKPRPSWAGTMQNVHKGSHPGVASIVYLPMIDLNPSDPVCIRSTLHYFADHASTHDVTPVVTFDQPLFYKVWQIIQSEPQESPLKKIVLKMGGLHTLMSFLGSI